MDGKHLAEGLDGVVGPCVGAGGDLDESGRYDKPISLRVADARVASDAKTARPEGIAHDHSLAAQPTLQVVGQLAQGQAVSRRGRCENRQLRPGEPARTGRNLLGLDQ